MLIPDDRAPDIVRIDGFDEQGRVKVLETYFLDGANPEAIAAHLATPVGTEPTPDA